MHEMYVRSHWAGEGAVTRQGGLEERKVGLC